MVSVIIPLYNVEKYVEWCLLSFENQNYKDFEIIVVNDGSKDNSATVVEDYINRSQMKIKLIHQENAGVSAARNKGIENAAGQYICFVDSDDMVAPNYLGDMIDSLEKSNCEIVICGVKYIKEVSDSNLVVYKEYPIEKMDSYHALVKFLYRDITPGIWTLMTKREIIERNKLHFAEGYRYSEDIEMIFKMFGHSQNIVYLRNELYLYRIRDTSVMSLVDDKRLDGFELMKKLETYFDRARPDFAKQFRTYGVARWVWATVWQIATASTSYNDFINNSNKYDAKFYMKKLLNFPKRKVSISALVYTISPFIYYSIVKKIINNQSNRVFKTS
ncbi:MAG: glycosyltransferase family 2 protein [Bacillota bacterium]